MKKIQLLVLVTLLVALPCLPTSQASAQLAIVEAVKGAAKKIIKAVDLKIQRLQNGVIDAQNIQKGLENLLSKLQLDDIADWTLKQKEQYQVYFNELWKVKAVITYYHRFRDLLVLQKQILQAYGDGFALVRDNKNFTSKEIALIYQVYTGMVNESLSGLDDILAIMQSFTVQMSDAERLALIDETSDHLETLLSDMRGFNNNNKVLHLQRAAARSDLERMKALHAGE